MMFYASIAAGACLIAAFAGSPLLMALFGGAGAYLVWLDMRAEDS